MSNLEQARLEIRRTLTVLEREDIENDSLIWIEEREALTEALRLLQLTAADRPARSPQDVDLLCECGHSENQHYPRTPRECHAPDCRCDSFSKAARSPQEPPPLDPPTLELNAWRELGEEMARVISLMPQEQFEDWFPDWFGSRLFDLQLRAAALPVPPAPQPPIDDVGSITSTMSVINEQFGSVLPAERPQPADELRELVKEASEIMQITYAGNFPAGIDSFLIRAGRALAVAPVVTKQYPCGCSATGAPNIPDYCPEHGEAAVVRPHPDILESDVFKLALTLMMQHPGSYRVFKAELERLQAVAASWRGDRLRALVAELRHDASLSLNEASFHARGTPEFDSAMLQMTLEKKHADKLEALLADPAERPAQP